MIAERKVWKRWRSAVRRRIKTSVELRRDYRRTRSQRKRSHTWGQLRFLPPLALAIALLSGEAPLSGILNLLLFWTLMVTFLRAQFIVSSLHNPSLLSLFFGWPVTDGEVFARQRKLILQSSLWLGVDWLVFGLALAFRTGDAGLALLAPLLAIGQWAAALAIALWLVRAWPRFPYVWLTTPFGIVMVLALRTHSPDDALYPYLNALWHGLYVATPGGWLAQGWLNFSDGHPFGLTVIFGLSSAAVFAVHKGAQAARAAFNPEKLFGYEESPATENTPASASATAVTSTTAIESDSAAGPAPESGRSDPAETRAWLEDARAHASDVLPAPAGRALSGLGPIERAISWFLTPRQRALVDFMRPAGKPWLRRWQYAGVALLAAFALGFTSTPDAAAVPALLALAFSLPLLGGTWVGFVALRILQTQIGISAYVPAGFGEIARLVLKINALRCLAALPLVLLAVHLGLAPDIPPPDRVLDMSLRLLGLVLAVQPICIIGKFSSNTNDSSGRWYFMAALLLLLVTAALLFVMLTVIIVMTDSLWVAAGSLLGLNALTHAFLAFYGLAWGRGWFDLIGKPKQ